MRRDEHTSCEGFRPPHDVCGLHWVIPGACRCGALRAGMQSRHSGGAGAPPGDTTVPCQELADDPRVYSKREPVASTFVQAGKRGT